MSAADKQFNENLRGEAAPRLAAHKTMRVDRTQLFKAQISPHIFDSERFLQHYPSSVTTDVDRMIPPHVCGIATSDSWRGWPRGKKKSRNVIMSDWTQFRFLLTRDTYNFPYCLESTCPKCEKDFEGGDVQVVCEIKEERALLGKLILARRK